MYVPNNNEWSGYIEFEMRNCFNKHDKLLMLFVLLLLMMVARRLYGRNLINKLA